MSKNPPRISDLEYLLDKFDELPDKKVLSNIVECAERNRVFPPQSPFPGKMKYSKTPYMIEPAMELSPQSDTEEVVIMKCGQGGATACASEPLILFGIMEDPSPILAITATDELAKTWEEDRLDPMFESSGAMKLFKSTVKKNSQHGGKGQSSLKKTFPGGRLDIKTYGKISQIRQISYQKVVLEEEEEQANAKKTGVKQGNFRDVAYARTRAFKGRRKILRISTPLLTQTSVIYPAFLAGDQNYFYVPCPDCGHMQRLEWKHLKYEKDEHNHIIPGSVYYECQSESCDFKIKNEHKTIMLPKGEWRPHNKNKAKAKTKSYTFSALYVPPGMDTWEDLAQQWVDAQGDADKLQVFFNLNLGLPFTDYADAPPAASCHILKRNYSKGSIPTGADGGIIFATMGVDLQAGNKRDDKYVKGKEPRIEASLWGWGLNNRSWLLDHYIIKGDITDWKSGAYFKFREMILRDLFPIKPVRIFMDAGHQTDQVYQFCNGGLNIYPVMGDGNTKKGYFQKVELQGFQTGDGLPLPRYDLYTPPIKRRIYNSLGFRQDPLTNMYPNGFRMFPIDIEPKYFDQLVSEIPTLVKKGNKQVIDWLKHGANETFDTAIYAELAKESYIHDMSMLNGEEATNHRKFWEWAVNDKGFYSISEHDLNVKRQKLHKILYN